MIVKIEVFGGWMGVGVGMGVESKMGVFVLAGCVDGFGRFFW